MKISKLFHWLYAILMLLPFAFFVPSVFYYAFNDNATMQSVEVPKTEIIAVDFNQLVNLDESTLYDKENSASIYIDNSYSSTTYIFLTDTLTFEPNHKYLYRLKSSTVCYRTVAVGLFPYVDFNDIYNGYSRIVTGSDTGRICVINTSGNTEGFSTLNFNLYDLTKMFGVGNEPTIAEFNNLFPNFYYDYNQSELMQITYDTGTTEQLIENTSIINYAWESIWDLPLFSWTKVTFVSVPFAFLTGIFGLGASNSLNYVFGYFLTISIVWLVFDVIMYVPMLVHRWIDKARIE